MLSVLRMSDHEVHLPDGTVEVDLWAILNGEIVLGEAKIADELDSSTRARRKKSARLRRVADALTADRFVLATARPAWTPSTVDVMAEAFAGSRCRLEWLVDVDPLSSIAVT
jgi:hypothetical protein